MIQHSVKVLSVMNVLISLLQWEKVARFTATDEVLLQYIAETNPISLCSHPDTHPKLNHPVSATPTAFAYANRSIPARFAVA